MAYAYGTDGAGGGNGGGSGQSSSGASGNNSGGSAGYYSDSGFSLSIKGYDKNNGTTGTPWREGSKVKLKVWAKVTSSYYIGELKIGGVSVLPRTLSDSVNGVSFENDRTVEWECPGPFSVHDVSVYYHTQAKGGGPHKGTVYYKTGSISTPMSVGITLNPNGGTLQEGTESGYVYYGEPYENLPTPKRPGYKFLGWFTERDGGTLIDNADNCTFTTNQIFYAHWKVQTVFRKVQNGTMTMYSQAFVKENSETKQAISMYVVENHQARQCV